MPIPAGSTDPTSIVTLADVYAEINVINPDGTDDDELQGFIDAISAVVQNITGPILPVTYSEWYDGGSDSVLLMQRPVVSVTSVVEYQGTVQYVLSEQSPDANVPLDAFGYFVNYAEGWIQRTAYGVPSWFAALPWWAGKSPGWYTASPSRNGLGLGRVKVVYKAGFETVPRNVRLGVLELIRINWQPQQSGNLPGVGTSYDAESGTTYLGFFIPNRVRELLAPNEQSSQMA